MGDTVRLQRNHSLTQLVIRWLTLTFIRKLYCVTKPRNLRLRVGRYFTLEQDFLPAVDLFDGRFLVKNWTPAKSKRHRI